MTSSLITGLPTSIQLIASGGTPPYTYSIASGLPAGLSLNASTGLITGTPTTLQTATALVWGVQDSASPTPATSTDSFLVTVAAVPLAPPHYQFVPRVLGGMLMGGGPYPAPELYVAITSQPMTMAAVVIVPVPVVVAIAGRPMTMAAAITPRATVDVAIASQSMTMAAAITQAPTVDVAITSQPMTMAAVVQNQSIDIAISSQPMDMAAVLTQSATVDVAITSQPMTMAATLGGAPWTPSAITTLLWLDAGDTTKLFDATTGGSLPANNGQVARIEDKSGNNYHGTQSTSGARPLRLSAGLNSLSTLSFDGTDDALRISTATVATLFNASYKLYVVFKATSSTNNSFSYNNDAIVGDSGGNWSTGVRSNGNVYVGNYIASDFRIDAAYTQNTWAIAQSERVSGDYGIQVNLGTKTTSTRAAPGVTSGTIDIFRNYSALGNTYCLQGELAEIIVVASATTDVEDRINGYLAHRWGLTSLLPGGHPYKTTPPTL